MVSGNTHVSARTTRGFTPRGFTIVELLVVMGIIAMLISMLMPMLSRARASAESVQCASNLRQLGIILTYYTNDNNGWPFPVGPDIDGAPSTYGSNVAPHLRWPMHVPALNINMPDKMPYDPNSYDGNDPDTYKADLFTPPILRCPADLDPAEAHSYVLNKHLADKRVRAGRSVGVSTSDIVLMGEKKTQMRDYYMENSDFERLVEQFRHGVKAGSNYLFLDGSVRNTAPAEALKGIDPWDPPVEKPPETGAKP